MIGIEGTPPYVATFEDAAVPVAETKQTYQQLEQELEVWRHGPSCWSCGDSGDVHQLDGEWLGKCDCLAAQLIDVTSERDWMAEALEDLLKGSGTSPGANKRYAKALAALKSIESGASE